MENQSETPGPAREENGGAAFDPSGDEPPPLPWEDNGKASAAEPPFFQLLIQALTGMANRMVGTLRDWLAKFAASAPLKPPQAATRQAEPSILAEPPPEGPAAPARIPTEILPPPSPVPTIQAKLPRTQASGPQLKTTLEMVTSHWCQPVTGLNIAPSHFYELVVREIETMKIPGVKFSRVHWKEFAFIGAEREYLRVMRSRFVYDICAAPFGAGSFFSSWLCIVPYRISLAHLIGNLCGIAITAIIPPIGAYFLLCLMFQGALWWVMSRQLVNTSGGVDFLLGLTGIGPFLCALAQAKPTYYQIDAAAIFQTAVQQKVMQIVDDLCEEQNVRPLAELDRKPIAREFLKK